MKGETMKPAEAKKFLKEHGVKYVLAQFVDIHGAAKAKSVPVEHYDTVTVSYTHLTLPTNREV